MSLLVNLCLHFFSFNFAFLTSQNSKGSLVTEMFDLWSKWLAAACLSERDRERDFASFGQPTILIGCIGVNSQKIPQFNVHFECHFEVE